MTNTGPEKHSGKIMLDQAADRRKGERFPFCAVAQIVEPKSKVTLTVRISDISYSGCYADSLNVFPVGTLIRLSVRHSDLQLDINATIVYSRSGLGMGLVFDALPENMNIILERYIAEAKGEAPAPAPAPIVSAPQWDAGKASETESRAQQHCFNRLISLMTHKGLLTPSEANELTEKFPRNG